MINYETILSTFDDKLTLMQWLQKVEQALEGAGLESVEIHQQSPTTAYFKFVFADGTSVTTPSITLPRGPKGDTGATGATGATGNGIASITKTGSVGLVDTYTILYTNGSTQTFNVKNGANGADGADGADGVGIDNVAIVASTGVLKVTLTDETEINAGNVYNVVTIDLSGGYSGTLSASDLALVKLANTVIIDNNLKAYKYDKERIISASETLLRYSNLGIDDNSILTIAYFDIDEDTGAWSWNEGSPYVDAINSGTATNGQVLTADGNGGASWQNASGGSTLYQHNINISGRLPNPSKLKFTIINDSNTALTTESAIASLLYNKGYDSASHSLLAVGTNKQTIVGQVYLFNIFSVFSTDGITLSWFGYAFIGNSIESGSYNYSLLGSVTTYDTIQTL